MSSTIRKNASNAQRLAAYGLTQQRWASSGASSNIGSAKKAASGSAGEAPAQASAPSLWANLRRAIFPISSESAASSASASLATAATGRAGSATGPAASAGVSAGSASGPRAAARAASDARAARREAGREQADAFKPMSKPAEMFSGTLLKAAVLLITVPLGVHMMSHSLMVSLCIKGLEAERPETVVLTLKRVRDVVGHEYLANRFEDEDGVALLVACFNERATPEVMREFLRTAQHLLKFERTREGLLMASLVERLERAQAQGWVPPDLRESLQQLYLDAHALRRMGMGGSGGPPGAGGAAQQPAGAGG